MKKTNYAIDYAKIISAILVVCIHTAPLSNIAPEANFFLVQILARIAVPFYFICAGYFLFKKINFQDIKSEENKLIIKNYAIRIFKLYAIWSIIYIPLNIFSWFSGGFHFNNIIRYVRDFFFTGSFYHLWFMPSLIIATLTCYYLLRKFSLKTIWIITAILYFIGMLGNVYSDVLLTIPLIKNIFSLYISVFETTRNGFFFGSIFMFMGASIAIYKKSFKLSFSIVMCIACFGLLCVEAYTLRKLNLMNDLTSMYVMLVPLIYFLMQTLLKIPPRKQENLFVRQSSFLVYVSHLWFVTILAESKIFDPSIIFVLSLICSFGIAYAIIKISQRNSLWKKLYI